MAEMSMLVVKFLSIQSIYRVFGVSPATARACLVACLGLLTVAGASAQVPTELTGSVIEEQVEDGVEDQVEQEVEEDVVDSVEEEVQEVVEDRLDRLLLGPGDSFVEDQVEAQVEEQVANTAEEVVEEAVEEVVEQQITDTVAQDLEEGVEDTVEEAVEESVADSAEEAVTDQVEETVASSVEETVASGAEQEVQQQVEQQVTQQVEQGVEQEVEQQVEEVVQQEVAQTVEASIEDEVEQGVAVAVESVVEAGVADSVEERLETEIDDILDGLESDLEIDESRILKEQWLVMAEPAVFEELAEQGYLFDTVTDLPSLGMRLAEVAGPSSFDITAVRRGVLDVVGKDRAEVDLNHIYTAGAEVASVANGMMPRVAAGLPEAPTTEAAKIGMIDSGVDTAHPSLSGTSIETRSFVGRSANVPDFHGTAIASIIAASGEDYQGLAPNAEVYAAAVFEMDEERGEIASTVSLLRALDWLISADVDVVNISLAGPPNRLLEAALKRAAEQQVIVLAAAGNGGPIAKPMYPAAYDSVIAVTAVDAGHRVFRLANRGDYLDIAAPGVGLVHAKAGGGYAASSGTSFAVPFAATAAAQLIKANAGADVMSLLYASAEDLGAPGRDDIYGNGLLRFAGN